MFYAVDAGAVVVGGVLGLALSIIVIGFLLYAAVRAARAGSVPDSAARLVSGLTPLTRHEMQFSRYDPTRHNLDPIEW